ncbi:hypothetical protein M2317_000052 [Microbacterium sp. ZKA21]|uniref:hypothetical protein n=1 Tax=Microbacterium sp. ZKA21 TaxID=3381694 RepID=UPI003D21F5D4
MNTYDNAENFVRHAWLRIAAEALGRHRAAGPMSPNAAREADAFAKITDLAALEGQFA